MSQSKKIINSLGLTAGILLAIGGGYLFRAVIAESDLNGARIVQRDLNKDGYMDLVLYTPIGRRMETAFIFDPTTKKYVNIFKYEQAERSVIETKKSEIELMLRELDSNKIGETLKKVLNAEVKRGPEENMR